MLPGGIGAALTVGVRRGSVLLSLLVQMLLLMKLAQPQVYMF